MFVCGVPRSSSEFSRVLKVEQGLFGDLSVPTDVAHQIFESRPEIYAAVIGPDEAVAAYSSAYPLQKKWADALVAGDITEPELTSAMLLTRQDCHEASSIYVGSVVVGDGYDPIMKSVLLASLFSWRVRQMQHISINRLSFIMTAVTKQGERMIRKLGARQLNAGANRKDGYAIYGRVVTPRFLFRATAAMERCLNSGIVQMSANYIPNPHASMHASLQPRLAVA
jgi:hypothetical protein